MLQNIGNKYQNAQQCGHIVQVCIADLITLRLSALQTETQTAGKRHMHSLMSLADDDSQHLHDVTDKHTQVVVSSVQSA